MVLLHSYYFSQVAALWAGNDGAAVVYHYCVRMAEQSKVLRLVCSSSPPFKHIAESWKGAGQLMDSRFEMFVFLSVFVFALYAVFDYTWRSILPVGMSCSVSVVHRPSFNGVMHSNLSSLKEHHLSEISSL